jgi:hypothetical protein
LPISIAGDSVIVPRQITRTRINLDRHPNCILVAYGVRHLTST